MISLYYNRLKTNIKINKNTNVIDMNLYYNDKIKTKSINREKE